MRTEFVEAARMLTFQSRVWCLHPITPRSDEIAGTALDINIDRAVKLQLIQTIAANL